MRLEIILSPRELRFSVPINYNYLIFNSLLNILNSSPVKFHTWFADDGKSNRILHHNKLFTFSKLLCPNSKVSQTSYTGFGDVKLLFSAPFEDDIAPLIITTLKNVGLIKLYNRYQSAEFNIKSIKQLPEPDFEKEAKFIMLSPTVVSKLMFHNGNKILHFYRINESETEGAIAYNLRKKYEIIHKAKFNGAIEVKFDYNYVQAKGGAEGVSKLITIREGAPDEFKIKGFIAPISLKSEPEILRIAYQCGIGELNCLGLGMVEVVSENKKIKRKFTGLTKSTLNQTHHLEKMECIPV